MKRTWLAPAVIILVALVLRVAYFEQIRSSPFLDHPIFDARDYLDWAEEITEGNLIWDEPRLYPPGYPYFLAAVSILTGHDLPAMTFANAVLGCGWILMLVLALRRLLPSPAAEVSGILAATCWLFVHFEAHLLSETLFIFLCVAALYLLTRGRPGERSRSTLIAAGACLGIATITRPNAAATVPFVLLLLILEAPAERRRRRLLVQTLPLLAALVAVVVPVVVRTHELTGMWSLRHHMAFNVYLGNRAEAPGYHEIRPGREWDRLSAEPEHVAAARTLTDHERYYRNQVAQFARESPVEFMSLQLRKLGLFFHAHEIRVIMSPYFFDRYAPLQAFPLLPSFGFIGPLAIAGLVLALRDRRRPWLLYCFAVPQTLAVVLTVIGSRYRLPVLPFLIPFAAYAIVRVTRWAQERRLRPLATGIVSVAALFWLVNRDLPHAQELNFAEEMERVAFVLNQRGEPAEAARWLEAAMRENAGRIETYLFYAKIALDVGDMPRAEAITRAGLQVHPGDSELLSLRGRAFLRLDQPDSAAATLEAAVQKSSDDAETWADLGRAFYDLGRTDESIAAFRRSLEQERDYPAALLDAALVLGETGANRGDRDLRAEARALLEHVLRLEPGHPEASQRLREWEAPAP